MTDLSRFGLGAEKGRQWLNLTAHMDPGFWGRQAALIITELIEDMESMAAILIDEEDDVLAVQEGQGEALGASKARRSGGES